MEKKPYQLILQQNRETYSVILRDVNGENVEKHNFGSDLQGALIKAQAMQVAYLDNDDCPNTIIEGFPNKHPNQTTLDI